MNRLPVEIKFIKALPADIEADKVPDEHYSIVEKQSQKVVGGIRFRLSNREDILLYAGHIGYNVDEMYRGKHYAAYACLELKPIALRHGFAEVWITCDPDNWPSRKTCEYIGAELIDIVDLPEYLDMYQDGERQKCRYRWRLK